MSDTWMSTQYYLLLGIYIEITIHTFRMIECWPNVSHTGPALEHPFCKVSSFLGYSSNYLSVSLTDHQKTPSVV